MLIISWLYYLHQSPVGFSVYYNNNYYHVVGREKSELILYERVCACACGCVYVSESVCVVPCVCIPLSLSLAAIMGLVVGTSGYVVRIGYTQTHTLKLSPGLQLSLIGKGTVMVWASTPKPLAHRHKVKDLLSWPVERLKRGLKEREQQKKRQATIASLMSGPLCPPKALKILSCTSKPSH